MKTPVTGIRDRLVLDTLDPNWFWDRVDVKSPDKCWPWLMGCGSDGYGIFRLPNIHFVLRAHRVALLLKTQQPLNELHALHHCDNPPGCNPLCLWAGTNQDNMIDYYLKVRHNTLNRNGPTRQEIKINKEKALLAAVDSLINKLGSSL